MKILVTGAGGFIGSHLVELLLRRGHQVRAFVRYRSTGHRGHLQSISKELSKNLEVVSGDIADAFQVRSIVEGCDTVFHLAALISIPYSYAAPGSYVATNVNGTLNVLEACRHSGTKRLLVTSTSETYGTARYEPIDELHPLQAQSPYSATKIAADKLADSYYMSFNLPVTVVRPFNTYGPRQSARAIIPTIATQLAAGYDTIRVGSLWPERDLTFVEDTVAGFVALSECDAAIGETVNLGSGRKISIGDLVQLLQKISGKQAKVETDDNRIRPAKSEVGVLLANTQKVEKLTPWRANVTLEEGLARTYEYVKAHLDQYRPDEYQV